MNEEIKDSKEKIINNIELNIKKWENNEKQKLKKNNSKNKNNQTQAKIIFNIDIVQNKLNYS